MWYHISKDYILFYWFGPINNKNHFGFLKYLRVTIKLPININKVNEKMSTEVVREKKDSYTFYLCPFYKFHINIGKMNYMLIIFSNYFLFGPFFNHITCNILIITSRMKKWNVFNCNPFLPGVHNINLHICNFLS